MGYLVNYQKTDGVPWQFKWLVSVPWDDKDWLIGVLTYRILPVLKDPHIGEENPWKNFWNTCSHLCGRLCSKMQPEKKLAWVHILDWSGDKLILKRHWTYLGLNFILVGQGLLGSVEGLQWEPGLVQSHCLDFSIPECSLLPPENIGNSFPPIKVPRDCNATLHRRPSIYPGNGSLYIVLLWKFLNFIMLHNPIAHTA